MLQTFRHWKVLYKIIKLQRLRWSRYHIFVIKKRGGGGYRKYYGLFTFLSSVQLMQSHLIIGICITKTNGTRNWTRNNNRLLFFQFRFFYCSYLQRSLYDPGHRSCTVSKLMNFWDQL